MEIQKDYQNEKFIMIVEGKEIILNLEQAKHLLPQLSNFCLTCDGNRAVNKLEFGDETQ